MSPKALRDMLDVINRSSFTSEQERWATVRSLQKLQHRIMTPMDLVKKAVWFDPASLAVLRISVDVKLYQALCDGEGQKTTKALASACSVDDLLMGRILRELAALDYVTEADCDLWEPNELSKAMTDIKVASGFSFNLNFPVFTSLPDYFRKYGYRDPSEMEVSPFQFAHQTTLSNFEYKQQYPEQEEAFNHFMSGYSMERPGFSAMFPFDENVLQNVKKSQNLLVDVGGGKGHDLAKLVKRIEIPDDAGKIILQDLPSVIQAITDLPKRIEKMEFDFFQPQPVKGARAYYMHSVIHDWPNAKAEMILKNTAAAMEKGYSRLLIHEMVLPNKNLDSRLTGGDWLMLCGHGSLQRTEKMWRDLLEVTGFKVTAIHKNLNIEPQSVIEAELA